MTVYVDAAIHRFGRMVMCHMVSPDLDELHRMAAEIGVARRWFQDPRSSRKVSRPHYDVCKSKRALAVSLGAVECDRYEMMAISNLANLRLWGRNWREEPLLDPLRTLRGHIEGDRIRAWLEAQTGLAFPPPAGAT
jgi:Protein of unknown function (DUF4031)